MPKPYKDTSKATNALQTPKKGQNERKTQVTLADVINSILTFGFLAGALLVLSLFLPQKAHSYASLTNYPASQVKNNLPLVVSIGQNTATTYQAVKPNRHTLAIFVPVIHGATNPMITTSTNARHSLYAPSIASYDGLIGVNTTPFTGNSPSRLLSVVESRHPLPLVNVTNLTKIKGVANNG